MSTLMVFFYQQTERVLETFMKTWSESKRKEKCDELVSRFYAKIYTILPQLKQDMDAETRKHLEEQAKSLFMCLLYKYCVYEAELVD